MDPKNLVIFIPLVAIATLVYAYLRASWVNRQDPGNERMQLIGSWIAQGAMAFLRQEYRFLAYFVAGVAVRHRFTWGAWTPRISGQSACFLMLISSDVLRFKETNLPAQSVNGFVRLLSIQPFSQRSAD